MKFITDTRHYLQNISHQSISLRSVLYKFHNKIELQLNPIKRLDSIVNNSKFCNTKPSKTVNIQQYELREGALTTMIFSEIAFIFFILPIFIIGDFITRRFRSILWSNINLLAISILFYCWGESFNVLLLLTLGIFTYCSGLLLSLKKYQRIILFCSLSTNLGILIYFKYALWILSILFPEKYVNIGVPLPLGISFFTFHAISYLVDVFRGSIPVARSAISFLTYFCMFPHLVAGPIVRYKHIRSELESRPLHLPLFSFGVYRFLMGINKKLIIADNVVPLTTSAFELLSLGNLHFFDAWLGILAYGVQIYFDFSGYSDMAIGLAAMAGFRFEENFNRPYSSLSIREFWQRWHISLSSWLRDYLYIPLGGNKRGIFRTYLNLLIVFILCGLWHGANMTFLVWGLWHGMLLLLERLPVFSFVNKLPYTFARIYTTLAVLIGWVFFRSENIHIAFSYLKRLVRVSFHEPLLTHHHVACTTLGIGIILCSLSDRFFIKTQSKDPSNFRTTTYFTHILLSFLSIALLMSKVRSPFLYFNF